MAMQASVHPLTLPPDRRVLVVSDIHGNLPFLQGLLKKVGYSSDDILIVLGDILEKSTGGLDTLHYLMDLARRNAVYFLQGNCEDVTLSFLRHAWPDEAAAQYGQFWGEKCAWVYMAHQAGVGTEDPKDFDAARQAIEATFPEEVAFLRAMPTILLNDRYLFVHGGVPREDRLEDLTARACMKNDDFMSQGYSFPKYCVVGHWPVTLYRTDYPCCNPIIDRKRKIISIDGGCVLKSDGQLNALVIPEGDSRDFSWVSYDDCPVGVALDRQAERADPVIIHWTDHDVEVLERGTEFSLCRHTATGRTLPVLTKYLRRRGEQEWCEDTSDYRLAVEPGDRLSIVEETSRGRLVKKDGVTGWYFGRLKGPEREEKVQKSD